MNEHATIETTRLTVIDELFKTLEGNEIDYCHLKGNPHHMINSLSGESDIDMLFDEDQRERLETLLMDLGFKQFLAVEQRRYDGIDDYLALDVGTCKLIHLHAHFKLRLGKTYLKEYQPDLEKLILENRVYDVEYETYCISREFQLIVLFLTESLRLSLLHRYFRISQASNEKLLREYRWLEKRISDTKLNELLQLVFRDAVGINQIIKQTPTAAALIRFRRMARRELAQTKLYSAWRGATIYLGRRLYLGLSKRILNRFFGPIPVRRINPRGGIVAGVKTSDDWNGNEVADWLEKLFGEKMDVFRVELGREETGEAGRLKRLHKAKRRKMIVICTGFLPQGRLVPDLILEPDFSNNNSCSYAQKMWNVM